MKTYKEENTELLNYMFDATYLQHFKSKSGSTDYRTLELIVSPTCNLGCEYCYMHNFSQKLYPVEIRNPKKIVENTGLLIDWLISNEYVPQKIDLFSGEIFGQQVGYDVLDVIYDKYSKVDASLRPSFCSIPTNFTFIQSEELTQKVINNIERFQKINMTLGLSASFDGKYMEQNRPYIHNIGYDLNKPRDDEYYDKVFAFIKKYKAGLHPMIYSKGIELWPQNFLWFQEMMAKHGIPWKDIYMLQVRNAEWTKEQNKQLFDFMVWLIKWVMDKLDHDKEAFAKFITKSPYGFNILKSTIGKPNRGLPCSIQASPCVRLGDLKLVPCHRLMYDGQEYGEFIVENGKITQLEAVNIEMYIAVMSHDYRSSAYCTTCGIKNICTGGCLGSQFEINGDPFIPTPTTCAMQHALAAGIIKGFIDTGVYTTLIEYMPEEQLLEHEAIRKELTNHGI